ncbi:tetratricopeptide repeat-containing hybrid sensor histidine kinase/response regulator [Winogradskyella sp. UBA3174]|uniref:tetratricopeptide repeat-containing hybrid sensor histidine kinase/response regulator n=1 Tax=Winogradskyella sp. UBA3174 TaxID=1947785 RepID=UPI0025CDE650|nr:ATP-binding protein [Winogradskyella sp. UBA3174]|tara:strand:- start:46178 stop:48412 length:2235 start_codon:yes stop_codon:yes gene_type:complete
MSQIKYHLFVFLACFCTLVSAQQDNVQDKDMLIIELQSHVDQAKLDSDRGNYNSASDNLSKALEIAEKIDDKSNQGKILTKIAKVQYIDNKEDQANISISKALKIQREIDDYGSQAISYNIKGVFHSNREEYDSALDYFKSAKNLFEQEDLEEYISEVTLNKAKVYIALKRYDDAKSELENTIIITKKYKQKRRLSSALIQSSIVSSSLGNINLALTEAEKGLTIAQESNNAENINEAYLTLSTIHENNNDYKNSFLYIKKYNQLSDSLSKAKRKNYASGDTGESINEYKKEYEDLKNQMDEVKAEGNFTRITTVLSIALITILSLLTLSLYKNNNIRLKTNNMLHKKNDELIVAKEKAELASKTKANFLSTVTHELRTPLYAVTGLTNMLLEEEPKEHQVQHLKSLKFSGDYLLTFINDILQINKIEANKVELDPESFNLKNKIENVISALSNSAKDNGTKLHCDYDNGIPESYNGDQLKISQILINLLGNAIKFTKDGDIWVRAYKINVKDNLYTLRFEIEDNGIGITKEKQDHMFESFSQGSVQINRKYGGTGLGLSIVKGLIQILKGKIYLKSELGKGTTFFFELPLEHIEEVKETKVVEVKKSSKMEDLDLSEIKILIVEDNKINQMITKKILNKMGLSCDVVDNGEDAVEQVKSVTYNVVLMDIHMPGISGLEATKIIRTFDKDLTVFALTAVTLEDKMHEFGEAGFNDIISKPFKQEDFEQKLYDVLSGKEVTSSFF